MPADTPAAPDDERLVERFLARRDESAFRSLYRAHGPYLWGLALRLSGGDASAAEELVQETWARSLVRLESFGGRSALRTWLAGILVNCWRESRRALRWTAAGSADAAPSAERSLPPASALAVDVERALAALPDGLRAVLLLFDLEGYTHPEIGERLGIPVGTSKRRLFDARRLLRRRLAGDTP